MRIRGWVGLLALAVCSAAPGIENPLSPLGPVGYWTGDDPVPAAAPAPAPTPAPAPPAPAAPRPAGAADASGNGRTGAYAPGAGVAANVPALKFPNPGCFTFDGVAGMVTVPDAPGLRMANDFTLSFWKRKTAPNADWVRIVGKGGGGPRNFGIWEFPAAENRLKFQIYNPNGGSVLELDTPAPIAINTWAHILVVVAGTSAQFWVNGALVASGQKNGQTAISADPLTLGHAGYHGFFAGQIDDVRLYDRALSMTEIVHLAQGNGGPAAPAGLAAKSAAPKDVVLTWAPSPTPPPAGTFTIYSVKRSKTPGSGHVPLAGALPATVFTDSEAEAGATYSYVVTAINTGGESTASNEITVTVPAK